MAKDKDALADPPKDKWDLLFNSTTPIHGAHKVAGVNSKMVDSRLNDIKSILGHPTLIINIAGQSLPATTNSRVDGHMRPKDQGLNGHKQYDSLTYYEHSAILTRIVSSFGFEDGVSQALLAGINTDADRQERSHKERTGRHHGDSYSARNDSCSAIARSHSATQVYDRRRFPRLPQARAERRRMQ